MIGKINKLKSNIETFISDVNMNDLKASVNTAVKEARADFNKLVNKDLESMKKKHQKEKTDVEKKAKKFLEGHKKEINALQAKFEKLRKATATLELKMKSSGELIKCFLVSIKNFPTMV